MKKLLTIAACALISLPAGLWAQSAPSGSEERVLEEARKQVQANEASAQETPDAEGLKDAGSEARKSGGESEKRPFTPVVLSFLPGISIPNGIYDCKVDIGLIGTMSGNVNGMQVGWTFALAENIEGLQATGVFAIAEKVHGVQASGIFNMADSIEGLQASGVFNMADTVHGPQAAGVFNMAESVRGVQAAGVFNMAETVDGIQAAGVFNMADTIDGVQAAGVFNVAKKAKGMMIGLVNVADELDGSALGLVNIIGNGINDISADWQWDSNSIYVSWRTGTPLLYSVFYSGFSGTALAGDDSKPVTIGYGLGHRFMKGKELDKSVSLDLEFCAENTLDATCDDWEDDDDDIDFWDHSFLSFRASLNLPRMLGFVPYAGFKADITRTGSEGMPEYLQTSSFSHDAYKWGDDDFKVDIWPRFYVGIRY